MDFGIAKLESGGNITASGNILGTPNYMSPEQARGAKVDGRSDLFSLGCVAYECLTGAKPFRGENLTSILLKILTEEPPFVNFERLGFPGAVSEVLRKALAKEPATRYASGAELMEALAAAATEAHAQSTLMRMTALTAAAVAPVAPATLAPPPVPESEPSVPMTVRRTALEPAGEAASPSGRRAVWKAVAAAALLVALAAGVLWSTSGDRSPTGRPAEGKADRRGDVSWLARLLGKKPRLIITIPESTRLALRLETPLSSETAQPGDAFVAQLAGAVSIEGVVALAAGSKVSGHVAHVAPAGKVEGRGELTLELDRLTTDDGSELPLLAKPLSFKARSTAKKDAGVIGGLAGVGALVGGLFGGKKGAATGGAVGGSAGAGAVLATKGEEVVLAQGVALSTQLASVITVTRSVER